MELLGGPGVGFWGESRRGAVVPGKSQGGAVGSFGTGNWGDSGRELFEEGPERAPGANVSGPCVLSKRAAPTEGGSLREKDPAEV